MEEKTKNGFRYPNGPDNLRKAHPMYWAEHLVVHGMTREQHDAEHDRMGGNLDTEDRVKHLIHHIVLKIKEGNLPEQAKEHWIKTQSEPWFLPYAEWLRQRGLLGADT